MKYNRFLPLVVPVLVFLLIEIFIRNPQSIYIVIVLVFLLFLFTARQFLLVSAKIEKWWNVVIQPMIFFLGTIGFVSLISSTALVQTLVVVHTVFQYLYFRTLYFYLVKPNKNNRLSLSNLSSYGNFLAFYFLSATAYGLQAFLNIPVWILMFGLIICVALVVYQVFWSNEIPFEQSILYIAISCVVLLELAWSISFLTLSFYILGLVLAVVYYILIGISRFHLMGNLNSKIIKKYLIFGLASIMLVLFTARWI